MDDAEKRKYLDDVRSEIGRLARLIAVPPERLPSVEREEGGTWLSVDWHYADDGDDEDGWRLTLFRNEGGYDWTIAEVGIGYENYLLYVIFDEITATIAMNRVSHLDRPKKKRAWFAERESLLATLNADWASKAAREHARHLASE